MKAFHGFCPPGIGLGVCCWNWERPLEPQCEARGIGRISGMKCSRLGQSLEKLGKALGVLGQSGYVPRCAT